MSRARNQTGRGLIRRVSRSVVTLHGSPEQIVLGTAIGVFIAFTPTVGLQMILGAFDATLLGASRPAAVIPAWITNPVTIPPVYALTYWLGSLFRSGPPVSEVHRRLVAAVKGLGEFNWYAIHRHFLEFLSIGYNVFVLMMIGGVIVGALCSIITYPIVLRLVRTSREEIARARKRRSDRRVAKKARRAGRERSR